MPATRSIRDEDLMALPRDANKYEVVGGELRVMSPAGGWHELVVVALIERLNAHVRRHGLGRVFGSNVMYAMPGGNRRCPDVSFIRAERLPQGRQLRELLRRWSVLEVIPDLVVEVLSPSDTAREVLDKVGEYLSAGVRLVWVIDPGEERATAYRSPTAVKLCGRDDALDGEDVVPAFRCPLGDLFE